MHTYTSHPSFVGHRRHRGSPQLASSIHVKPGEQTAGIDRQAPLTEYNAKGERKEVGERTLLTMSKGACYH